MNPNVQPQNLGSHFLKIEFCGAKLVEKFAMGDSHMTSGSRFSQGSANSNGTRGRRGQQYCFCGEFVEMHTAWTMANPGRRFLGCPNYKVGRDCGWFQWIDEPLNQREKTVFFQQQRRIRELEAENNKLKKYRMVVFILCVVLVVVLLVCILKVHQSGVFQLRLM